MIALLRYAFLRSSRESLLYSLLFGPGVMLVSPLLVIACYSFIRGQSAYPVSLDDSLTPEATARLVGEIGRMLGALSASFASFSIFRQELADRSLGFFLLAIRSRSVVLAATVYGVVAGLAGFLVLVAGVAALTAHWPPFTPALFASLIVSTVAAAALGAAIAAISPEQTMLVAAAVGSLVFAMILGKWPVPFALLLILITGALLIEGASTILRRRCTI